MPEDEHVVSGSTDIQLDPGSDLCRRQNRVHAVFRVTIDRPLAESAMADHDGWVVEYPGGHTPHSHPARSGLDGDPARASANKQEPLTGLVQELLGCVAGPLPPAIVIDDQNPAGNQPVIEMFELVAG